MTKDSENQKNLLIRTFVAIGGAILLGLVVDQMNILQGEQLTYVAIGLIMIASLVWLWKK